MSEARIRECQNTQTERLTQTRESPRAEIVLYSSPNIQKDSTSAGERRRVESPSNGSRPVATIFSFKTGRLQKNRKREDR